MYGYGYYHIDAYYFIFVVPALIFAMWAQSKVTSTFNKYSRHTTFSRMTGYEAARRILDAHGLRNVAIEHISGNLTDHYDPRTNVIRLSDSVYASSSVAAIGVAAHEAGHACQYAEDYMPIRVRSAIIPVSQIGSRLSVPLVIMGFLFGLTGLVKLGITLFATVALFQLVTLPVEFNASNRAINVLAASGSVTDDELYGVQKVLGAAALTYVAALATSLGQLMRLVLLANRRNRR